MPELQNYSSYNRDKREYLPGFVPQNDTPSRNIEAIDKLEDSLKESDQPSVFEQNPKSEKELSDLAKRLLSFFNNAKNKEPKGIADIKKKDELREQGDIKIIIALEELVNAGELIFDGEDSWSSPDW